MAAWLDSAARARADTVIPDDWTAVTSRGDSLRLRNVLASPFNDSTETLPGARRFARRVRGAYQPRLAIVWDMTGDREPVASHHGGHAGQDQRGEPGAGGARGECDDSGMRRAAVRA
jgi:hypothetical protein